MHIKDLIETIPLLSQSTQPSKTKMKTYAITQKIKKGEYLFYVREEIERIYIMISGYAVLDRVNQNNDRRAIFLMAQGDIINEEVLEKPVSSTNCYALTDLEVISFTRIQFLEIMEHDFYFTRMILASMSLKMRKLFHQVENTTKMMLLEKQIASRLWKIGRDFGIQKENYLEIPFNMTITFLADLVGSNRETISRVVKKLSKEQLISIQNGNCHIYDMDALIEIVKK